MSGGGEVLNPVQVEQGILAAAAEVSEGVRVVSQRLEAYRTAERNYDAAWAAAFMGFSGSVEAKKQHAVLQTLEERQALDVAEVGFKYADRRCKAAESRLSAYQSIYRGVRAMYGAAGVEETH